MKSDEPIFKDALGRARRSTIEQFNDELAVLDRPLEDDVEYYDEPAPRRPWRRAAALFGALALLGGGTALAVSRRSAPVAERSTAEPPRVALVLAAPSLAPAPELAPPAALPPPAPMVRPAQPAATHRPGSHHHKRHHRR